MSIGLVIRISPSGEREGPSSRTEDWTGENERSSTRVVRLHLSWNGNSVVEQCLSSSLRPWNAGEGKIIPWELSSGEFSGATFWIAVWIFYPFLPRALITFPPMENIQSKLVYSFDPSLPLFRTFPLLTAIITHSKQVVPLATNRSLLFSFFLPFLPGHHWM